MQIIEITLFIKINIFSILSKTVQQKLKLNALVQFINFPCKEGLMSCQR